MKPTQYPHQQQDGYWHTKKPQDGCTSHTILPACRKNGGLVGPTTLDGTLGSLRQRFPVCIPDVRLPYVVIDDDLPFRVGVVIPK